MNTSKKVFVAPLDWGLGHATRCVPVIRKLLENNAEVIIAADNLPLAFLEKEFPDIKTINLPSFNIKYPSKGSMVIRMMMSIPLILNGIRKEHKLLQEIITENKIDIVISDNRWGLWTSKAYSVFITHQLMVKCPTRLKFLEPILNNITRRFIGKYKECWVPDFEDKHNLSGDLSHKYLIPPNTYFIGPLTRFNKLNFTSHSQQPTAHSINSEFRTGISGKEISKDKLVLIILSGPEPQRTILEMKLISQIKSIDSAYRFILIQGKADADAENIIFENLTVYSHLNSEVLFNFIKSAELVICRPGYSGVMDLVASGKKAVFIPTPGQTEQEYLADYLQSKQFFYYETQDKFDLKRALKESNHYSGITINNDEAILDYRIKQILLKLKS